MPLITHLRQVPVLEQTHWKTVAQMEKHDTQHHTEDLNEWSSLAAEKKTIFLSHNHKHQMNVIQVECIVTIRIQHLITDACISELQIEEIRKVIMKAFRS